MKTKTLLLERIELERNYLGEQKVGTKEYNESLNRLNTLLDKLTEIEKFESEIERKDRQVDDERKNRKVDKFIDVTKFSIGGIVVPVVMTLVILKWEETGSITTAMRTWITNNVPKKMF